MYANTKDDMFKKYFTERTSTKALEIHNKRIEEEKAAAAEKAAAEAEAKAAQEAQAAESEAPVEEVAEPETPVDAPVEEAPAENA
ncbi:hypothetical protein II582_04765 [bacterium]|nr:hypothetical protein [bacterium]